MSYVSYTVCVMQMFLFPEDGLSYRQSLEFTTDVDPELVKRVAIERFKTEKNNGCTITTSDRFRTMTIVIINQSRRDEDDLVGAVRWIRNRIDNSEADEEFPLNVPCSPEQHIKRVQNRQSHADR